MLVFKNNNSRGDTLIEVLVAITVFSAVAVGSLTVMNQGAMISQRALELTLVREEIDSQAEALRFINASYVAAFKSGLNTYVAGSPAQQWQTIRANNTVAAVSAFGANTVCNTPPAKSFVINTHKATLMSTASLLIPARTFSQIQYNASDAVTSAEGIWIEAIKYSTTAVANETTAGYIDFHIRACWTSQGQSAPSTIGTIVRLYEPL